MQKKNLKKNDLSHLSVEIFLKNVVIANWIIYYTHDYQSLRWCSGYRAQD